MSDKKTLTPSPWLMVPASIPLIFVAGLVLYNEWGSERSMDALREALRIVEEEGLCELEPRGREYAMLPFATSLDFRIGSDWSQKQHWSELISLEDVEKIRKESKSIEEAEAKLILTAIEKLKSLFPS